jgi:hypothetical protein
MLSVGFELTIPVFERENTVHTLDCAATVIGLSTRWAVQIMYRLIIQLPPLICYLPLENVQQCCVFVLNCEAHRGK